MGRLLDLLTGWVRAFFDLAVGVLGATLTIFEVPARELGVPPEVLAGGLLCVILLAFWRGLGGYWD